MLRLSYNSLYELLRAYYIYPHKTTQLSPMTYYYYFFSSCLGLAVFFFSVGVDVKLWPRASFQSRCRRNGKKKHTLCFVDALWAERVSRLLTSTDWSLRSFVKIVFENVYWISLKKTVWKVVFEIYLIYPRSSFENVSVGGDEWREKSNTIKARRSDGEKLFNHAWNDSFKRFN